MSNLRKPQSENHKAQVAAWKAKNQEKVREINRRAHRKRQLAKYGLTLDTYQRLWDQQGGRCAICGVETPGRSLPVDHCHATGRVRGLLCQECNMGLGKLGDTLERMQQVIAYLTAAKQEAT